eukprot:gene26591-32137_t
MPPKVNKIEAEIKKLSRLDGNKTCADCPEKLPGYVDLTHNVFVCTKCSGIHREFQFKVKGVSMSVFTEEDVSGLASMGNEAFNNTYLARLNRADVSVPNGSDTQRLKDFIRAKYVDRKWHRDHGLAAGSGAGTSSGTGHEASAAGTGGGRMSISLNKTASFSGRRASTGSLGASSKPSAAPVSELSMDLMSMTIADKGSSSAAAASYDPFGDAPAVSAPAAHFDPFADPPSSSTSAAAAAFDPFGPNAGTSAPSGGFDAFSSPPAKQSQPSSSTAFDAFGGAAAQNAASFPSFGGPSHVPTQPLPFIHTSPPAAPAPAASATSNAPNPAPATKNFSAFDDLLGPALPAAAPSAPSHNPFDAHNPFAAPSTPAHMLAGASYPHSNPGSQPYSNNAYAPYPPNSNNPYPNTNAPSAYPGPNANNPYPNPNAPSAYPNPNNPYPYPNNPYPNPNNPYPYPAAHPGAVYGYPTPPPGAAPYPSGGYPPFAPGAPNPANANPAPNPAPAAPAAPDPFAHMSSLAWNAVGGSAPSPLTASPAPSSASYTPVHVPAPSSAAVPPASVNPFDLF